MTRYLTVLIRSWRASIATSVEYRANFVVSGLTSIGTLVGGVFTLLLFYNGSYAFAGWSLEDCLVVLGLFKILTGFSEGILSPNLNRIVGQVEDGTLDFVLIKPIDAQFQVSSQRLSPWAITELVLGVVVVVYGLDGRWNPGMIPAAIAIGASLLLLYSMWFALASTSIWFVKIYNATEVLRGLLDAGRYPMAAFPDAWRVFFTFVVPVAFLTSVPAELALGRGSMSEVAIAWGVAALVFVATRTVWKIALRSYTSASS